MERKILVGYASGTGSTREVAQAIGKVLSDAGLQVTLQDLSDPPRASDFDAVVVGSSIRFGRWLPEAVRFVEEQREALEVVPVAYFTTCITMVEGTEDARRTAFSYMEPVLGLAPNIEPVGLGLFSGSLNPEYRKLNPLDVGPYGDFRDWDAIRAWAAEIWPALLEPVSTRSGQTALVDMVFSFTDLEGYDLSRFDLRRSEFKHAKLREANLESAILKQTRWRGADLRNANLENTDLSWSNLVEVNLQGAVLNQSNMMGANLERADLIGAKISGANLNGAIMTDTLLIRADLTGSDLNWADLRGADFVQANLRGARLGWANMRNANLMDADLQGARYNNATLWPEGFSPVEAGCVFVAAI